MARTDHQRKRGKSRRAVALGSRAAKAGVREGGIEAGKRDPMRHAPLREPYAASSGEAPERGGTPQTVSNKKTRRRRRGSARATG
jgi:hypothetical protein